jgi:hypothetical protein
VTADDYPGIVDLMSSWFHQDHDIAGNTLAEIVAAFRAVTPAPQRAALRAEILQFVKQHREDLEREFESTFRPEVIPSAMAGSTRAFLEQISDLLRDD